MDGNGLAATLPGEPGPELPMAITADLVGFLNAFPVAPGVAAMPWTDFFSTLNNQHSTSLPLLPLSIPSQHRPPLIG